MNFTEDRRQKRIASNKYWRRVRTERAALGLNSRGMIPKYERHVLKEGGCNLHGRKRHNQRQRVYRSRKYAAGLTALGKPKRGLIALTPLDRAWREERATFSVQVNSVEEFGKDRSRGIYQ